MSAILNVLLVEDNPAEAELMLEVLEDCQESYPQTLVASSGEEAMDILYRRNGHEDSARPNIILLDINLPVMNGKQVLAEVKSNLDLLNIPILMLTSSQTPEDINQCYQLHANAYMVKPVDYESLVKLMTNLEKYWFSHVRYPH
ncbi:MAG: response regulator [Bermanella sp.]